MFCTCKLIGLGTLLAFDMQLSEFGNTFVQRKAIFVADILTCNLWIKGHVTVMANLPYCTGQGDTC